MKKVWWKVPLYCVVMGWLAYQAELRLLIRFAIVRLPDGTVTINDMRSMIVSGILFAAILAVGGLIFFRRMSRKELLQSATVMVGLNIVGGLVAYSTQGQFTMFYTEVIGWSNFVSKLLYQIQMNQWISSIFVWAAPYLFVLFGKKAAKGEDDGIEPR